ncbi:unnamed protein product [Protopolystoma xenopodis]|uniref:Uncharacterized protein n=1 Tax=Protopolystoma xenopodis TaxID=117903 RepID=A0A448X9M6_9PLAT|nr:unnamed protein product [Protopolystoma xenopodis]
MCTPQAQISLRLDSFTASLRFAMRDNERKKSVGYSSVHAEQKIYPFFSHFSYHRHLKRPVTTDKCVYLAFRTLLSQLLDLHLSQSSRHKRLHPAYHLFLSPSPADSYPQEER